MRLHSFIAPVFLAAVVFAEVKIEQPSPYMSSPPPAPADTTVVDPGRKPNCEVQPGRTEGYYADWNLATDRPSGAPLEIDGPRKGMGTFRAAFDDNGWPTELAYFDGKGRARWTKLFKYPAQIPSGPGDVPYISSWIGSTGKAIAMTKIAEHFKATSWAIGMKKYEVGDLLGEPLIVEVGQGGGAFSGKPETWLYLIDGQEVRFPFDKNNRLVQVPQAGVKTEAAKSAPVAPIAADTAKAKPATAAAPADTAKAVAAEPAKPAEETPAAPKAKSGKKKANK